MFEPYYVYIANERLPHIGSGLRILWVDIGPKDVRYKRFKDQPRARKLPRKRWDAIPSILFEGQNMCTITEALLGTTHGTKCRIRPRRL